MFMDGPTTTYLHDLKSVSKGKELKWAEGGTGTRGAVDKQ